MWQVHYLENEELKIQEGVSLLAAFELYNKIPGSVICDRFGSQVYPRVGDLSVIQEHDPALPNVVVYERLKTLAA